MLPNSGEVGPTTESSKGHTLKYWQMSHWLMLSFPEHVVSGLTVRLVDAKVGRACSARTTRTMGVVAAMMLIMVLCVGVE